MITEQEVMAAQERNLLLGEHRVGRTLITTSLLPAYMQPAGYYGATLNGDTIAKELQRALSIHRRNASHIRALRAIYLGEQAILTRPYGGESNAKNRVVINYAQAFTRDIVGHTYSGGIQYVARDTSLVPKAQELAVAITNEYRSAVIKSMADDQSIFGTAYIMTTPDSLSTEKASFEMQTLDSERTCVVYSAYNKLTPVYAWTSFVTEEDGKDVELYRVYTPQEVYILHEQNGSLALVPQSVSIVEDEYLSLPSLPNTMEAIPIVEYPNNQFRFGDWESVVSLFNAINQVASDSINDVENLVKSVLCLFGVELGKNEDGTTQETTKIGNMIVFSGAPGITQDAKFVSQQLDAASVESLRSYLEEAMLVVAGIPSRDTGTSGSDTGVSAQTRTGSSDIDAVAANKIMYTKMAERRTLQLILKALELAGQGIDIDPDDLSIEIPHSTTDGMQSRVQVGAQLYEMNVAKSDIAAIMDLTTDLSGFVSRWEATEAAAEEKEAEETTAAAELEIAVAEATTAEETEEGTDASENDDN